MLADLVLFLSSNAIAGGNPYQYGFDLAPASSPTTFMLVSGVLPTGLSLWTVGNCVGRIWSFSVAVGTSKFTLRAANVYGSADENLTIRVGVRVIVGAGSGAAFS